MKAQILKIAGVKDEKAFYKKFPTEEAFMTKHGKDFKKAWPGASIPPMLRQDQLPGGSSLIPSTTPDTSKLQDMGGNKGGGLSDMLNPGMAIGQQIGGGIAEFIKEKKKAKAAKTWANVSTLQTQAAGSADVDQYTMNEQMQLNPWDRQDTGDEFFPTKGVGTNVLQGKNGLRLKRGGEILNNYVPNTLYQDLETYQDGGNFSDIMGSAGGTEMLNQFGTTAFENNAGWQMGKGVGSAVKMIPGVGPVVGAIAEPVIGAIGGGLDAMFGPAGEIKTHQKTIDKNRNQMTAGNIGKGISNQYSEYLENGGNLTNPQIITKFGDIDVSEFHTIAHQGMDSLRTGGNIKRNQMFDQDHFAMNGLSVYKGEAEPISTNPYLPEGGESVMFRGPSHKNGGMPIKFGDQGVEVEGGEPAVKLAEGGSAGSSLTVFGNLQALPEYLEQAGLGEYKGQKFKGIVKDLTKKTDKFNTLADKSIEKINDHSMSTPIDKIGFDSWKANFLGADKQREIIAGKIERAGALQRAINDSASEGGYDADALARGVIKKAKAAKTAENGIEFKTTGKNAGAIDYNPIATDYNKDYWNSEENYKKNWIPKVEAAFADPAQAKELISRIENYSGQDAADVKTALAKGKTSEEKIAIAKRLGTDTKIGPYHKLLAELMPNAESIKQYVHPTITPEEEEVLEPINVTDEPIPPAKSKVPWMDAINAVVPYIRPNYQLEKPDLSAEMMAMGFNQQEPVQARGMHSQLDVPYDISYQDILNKNQGDYRAMSRMAQNNPALLAQMNAQKYDANQQVLGEQFRANQAMKDKVYSQNRDTINKDQLTNLGIMDNQYTRQTSAKAKTQEEAVRIASSISDKLNRYKQEQTLSNLEQQRYNYRFDNNGRAINMNPLAQFNMSGATAQPQSARGELRAGLEDTYDIHGQRIGTRTAPKEDTSKNGKKIPARNGAIVRALKTI